MTKKDLENNIFDLIDDYREFNNKQNVNEFNIHIVFQISVDGYEYGRINIEEK